MRALESDDDWREVSEAPIALVYKRSPICAVSTLADSELRTFADADPTVPIFTLDVLAGQDLSARVAEEVGIRHESPQVILLAAGAPIWHASHFSIAAKMILQAVSHVREEPDGEGGVAPLPKAPVMTVPNWPVYLAGTGLLALIFTSDDPAETALWVVAGVALVFVLRVRRG